MLEAQASCIWATEYAAHYTPRVIADRPLLEGRRPRAIQSMVVRAEGGDVAEQSVCDQG